MKQLTAKLLHEKLKRGWIASDFATYLELDSDDAFWKLLEKQFSGTAYKEFKSSLNSNEKHRKRIKDHEAEHEVSSNENAAATENPSIELPAEQDLSDLPSSSPVTDSESSDSAQKLPSQQVPTLEELTANLEELLAELNAEELTHKSIVSSRLEIRNQILSHKESLIKIRKIIAEHERSIDLLLSDLANTEKQMSDSTLKIQILRELKDELEADIEKARQVSILVYDSGEIDLDAHSKIQFPDWSDLFSTIVEEDELDSLTIKQTKSLAKVITLVRSLLTQNTPYEISFENITLERYFKKVIS